MKRCMASGRGQTAGEAVEEFIHSSQSRDYLETWCGGAPTYRRTSRDTWRASHRDAGSPSTF